MKEIILVFSLYVDDSVDTDNNDELGEALSEVYDEQIAGTDWNWALEPHVVVPDDIGDDEYYELVRTKK